MPDKCGDVINLPMESHMRSIFGSLARAWRSRGQTFGAWREAFPWLAPLLLLGAVLAAHGETLRFATIEIEDFVRMFSGSGPTDLGSWSALFSPSYFESYNQNFFYRPLVTAMYRMGWLLFGSQVEAYQGAKLLLLWGSAHLLYLLALQWGFRRGFAFLAGTLFAVHALHVTPLLRLSFFDDLLLTFFSLQVLYAHSLWRCGDIPTVRGLLWIGASYAMALLSKEAALMLPFLLLLQETVLPLSQVPRKRASALPVAGIVLGVTVLYLALMSYVASGHYGSLIPNLESPFWKPIVRLGQYLAGFGSSLFPGSAGMAAPLSLLAVLLVLEWSLGSWRRGIVLLGWMVLCILPLLNIVGSPMLHEYFACESCFYLGRLSLPAAGFCLLVASVLQGLSSRGWKSRAAAMGLAAFFLGMNIRESRSQESATRWNFAEEVEKGAFLKPDYVFYESRFEAVMVSLPFLRRTQPETFLRIRRALREALPDHGGPTLADLFSQDSIYKDTFSYSCVLEALSHKGFAGIHSELGHIARAREAVLEGCRSLSNDDPAGGRRWIERARALYPGYAKAFPAGLARGHIGERGWERTYSAAVAPEAGKWFAGRIAEAVRLKDAGVALFNRGDASGAARTLVGSLDLNPDNLYTLVSLGAVYAHGGRLMEAKRLYDRALGLKQEKKTLFADLLSARANVLERMGRSSAADADREHAARLQSESKRRL